MHEELRRELEACLQHQDLRQVELGLRRLIPRAKRTGDPFLCAEIYSLIARPVALQGRIPAAYEALNDADFILMQAERARSAARIRYLIELGRIHQLAGWPDRARARWKEGKELASCLGESELETELESLLA
ncbi:MAG: hypothetical protein HY319_23725 [Armatimonadetes bacterium]|nr:hypothetical protein [Armatimonadota bacterium]